MNIKEVLCKLSWINVSELERICGMPVNSIQKSNDRKIPLKYIDVLSAELCKLQSLLNSDGYKIEHKPMDVSKMVMLSPTIIPEIPIEVLLEEKQLPEGDIYIEEVIEDDYDPDEVIQVKLYCGRSNMSCVQCNIVSNGVVSVNGIEYYVVNKYLVECEDKNKGLTFKASNIATVNKKYVDKELF